MPAIERILFFGTPEFAVPTLAALVAAGRLPLRVVTQPARPVGRGHKVQEPSVAVWAREHGLEVIQPEKVRDPAFLTAAAALAPEVAVVVAFGQIFPAALLRLPVHGCINLHASLLPRWRGAAPIQAAIAAGDERTGVTTMLMEEGLDAGPVLLQEETAIAPDETATELSRRLAEVGGRLMVRTLERLERSDLRPLQPRPQDPAAATYAPRLHRESGRVDWSLTAREISDRWRAYAPWPGLSAELRGEVLKLVRVEVLQEPAAAEAPGTYLGLVKGKLAVACGAGTVLGILELQRPGRKPLAALDFANGERLRSGESLS